jgi:hypothetical protein
MDWVCRTYGKMAYVCLILVRKPEGKKPLVRSKHRQEDNIKMVFRGGTGLDSTG